MFSVVKGSLALMRLVTALLPVQAAASHSSGSESDDDDSGSESDAEPSPTVAVVPETPSRVVVPVLRSLQSPKQPVDGPFTGATGAVSSPRPTKYVFVPAPAG